MNENMQSTHYAVGGQGAFFPTLAQGYPLGRGSAATVPWPDFMAGQPGRPVRVLLVVEDPHMCHVVAQDLVADPRVHLSAQGRTLKEGRRLVAQHDFEVLLVDLNLGDGMGFDLVRHLKHARPLAEAVVISSTEDEQHALLAFELGATGFLVKNAWFGDFSQAVLQVANGGASISPGLARRLLGKLEKPQVHGAVAVRMSGQGISLSVREREILKMVASGYTSHEVGIQLDLSGHTVNTHLRNVYRKLKVRTRAQAVSLATHRGLF